jgi:two-component system response regulator YesN
MTARDVARTVFLDPAYFSKLFKKTTGRNYNDYVTSLRMEKARQLLLIDEYSVRDIASEVGYRSGRHFSKLYKAYTGRLPSETKPEK